MDKNQHHSDQDGDHTHRGDAKVLALMEIPEEQTRTNTSDVIKGGSRVCMEQEDIERANHGKIACHQRQHNINQSSLMSLRPTLFQMSLFPWQH